MFKVFNYRLFPSTAQRARLESVLEMARRFYQMFSESPPLLPWG